MIMNDINELENKIGYVFKNKHLLTQALTHSSYANERKINRINDYERLEYLGDAVLELIVSEHLFSTMSGSNEGQLTKVRASYVCEYTLSTCAKDLDYGKYVLLSKGENLSGGRERTSILCDLFESVLGAIYLDSGMESARKYVQDYLLKDIENKSLFYDAKTHLQELVQKEIKQEISYKLIDEVGPEHSKQYTTCVFIGDKEVAKGRGQSHKASEQMAAYEALLILKNK